MRSATESRIDGQSNTREHVVPGKERLRGNRMNRFVVALLLCLSFALSSHAQTESFWTTSTVPANTTGNDKSSVELGLRFSSNVAGNVTGARVYCAKNSGGTHTVHLWN